MRVIDGSSKNEIRERKQHQILQSSRYFHCNRRIKFNLIYMLTKFYAANNQADGHLVAAFVSPIHCLLRIKPALVRLHSSIPLICLGSGITTSQSFHSD